MTAALTYRPNRTGTLRAAYLGTCRIGYVEARPFGKWLWQLSLVGEGGGHRHGFEDDEQLAQDALRAALEYWLGCAGLQRETDHHSGWQGSDLDWRLAPRRRATANNRE